MRDRDEPRQERWEQDYPERRRVRGQENPGEPEWGREDLEREEWEGGPEPEGGAIYGPYGRIDRSRQGISVRSRNVGRRMDLFGTGRSGFGTTWGGYAGRSASYAGRVSAGGERASYAGRGPRGWHRSDEHILEEVNQRLTDHPEVDATDIEAEVKDGEVTLTGLVETRHMKRLAEDVAEEVSGVRDVHNQLRIQQAREDRPRGSQPDQAGGTTGVKYPDGTSNR